MMPITRRNTMDDAEAFDSTGVSCAAESGYVTHAQPEMKTYVVLVTASIVAKGYDSDDAVQAPEVSRVLQDLYNHGWERKADVCSHTAKHIHPEPKPNDHE